MKYFQTSGTRLVTLLGMAFCAQSQMAEAEVGESHSRRPKIGLVLSGGGAWGVAHVGVLKALEELHIPIDCIAGTSMGAVVGGLYASGMSPVEIDDWFRTANWHFLLSDALPRESESFRSKQSQFALNQGIAFNVSRKAGLKLPAGLVAGRNVMASLRQLTVPVRYIHDFNRLPIPFCAIATDIETGGIALLRDGDFVEAIRASMSIPGVFTPQRIRGRMLVDGGMASNLPVTVVQEMGADVVIAIDVTQPLKKGADLDTAGAMANQVMTILIQRQTDAESARLGPGDILVRLKLGDMATTDFPKAEEGIDMGYAQMMERRAELARYSVGLEQFQQYLVRQRIARGAPVLVTFLRVRTPDGEFEHELREPIEFQVKDHARLVRFQSVIGDLQEMQKFDVGDYEVIGEEGAYGLLVKARNKKTGPTALSFGFGFGYSSADESDFSLLLSYSMTELNSLGAEWTTYLRLGNTTRVVTEWHQPMDWERRLFFAAQGLFGNDFVNGRMAAGDSLSFRQQDYGAGLDLGARLWQAGELRVGYARGFSRFSRRLGAADELPGSVDRGWIHADLTIDTLDAPSFSTRGTYAHMSLVASREELGASDNYTRIEGQFYQPFTFGKNTLVPRVSVALKIGGGEVPLYDQVPLGGFLNLSGLSRGFLFGQNTALAEVVYYRKLMEITPGVGRALYGGFSAEAGEAWENARDFHLGDAIFAGSIFLGADTALGGLYLGVGVAEGGDAAIYLQLGSLFGQGRKPR